MKKVSFTEHVERIMQRHGCYDCYDINKDISHNKTGNLWIECAYKALDNLWLASGIFAENSYFLYIVGDFDEFYILSKKQLRMIETKHEKRVSKDGYHKGFLLSLSEAKKFSIVSFEDTNKIKIEYEHIKESR